MSCCHCSQVCTGHDSNGNCNSWTEVCSHSYDLMWSLDVSTGDSITVDSCEPPSASDPLLWAKAIVGEPASVGHSYTNYLLMDPDSILNKDQTLSEEEEKVLRIPPFPSVYDRYKRHPVMHKGIPELQGWDRLLNEMNADIGYSSQVDVTLMVTDQPDESYALKVEGKWLYGPKNSVNIIAGTDGKVLTWVRVVTLNQVEELKVILRDNLKGWPLSDAEGGVEAIRQAIETKYTRTSMEEYSYLSANATPPTWALILLYLLDLAVVVGLGIWSHKEDIFGDSGRFRGFRGFGRSNWR